MLEGWYLITAALLAVSGGAKLRDPSATRGALRAAGLPSAPPLVRLLALAEVAAGGSALLVGGPVPALAVALLYLGFAAFVAWALARRLPLRSCGCFGREDTPPTPLHLGVDLAAASAAVAVAATGTPSLLGSGGPIETAVHAGLVALGAWFLALVLAELAPLLAASRGST